MVAVDVAQLTFAQAKFRSAKSMWMRRHIGPTQNGFMYLLSCAINCHKGYAFPFCSSHEVVENSEVILAVSSLDSRLKEFVERLWHRAFYSASLAKLQQVPKGPHRIYPCG
jgi:hypothetical protein